MTVLTSGKKHLVKKMSPNGHVVLAWRPDAYPLTAQQRKVQQAAAKCGIKKGSKPTLENFACIKKEFGHGV